jgi:hypothetical protein
VLDGWAEPEATHRWTMGRESRVVLPASAAGAGCVLVINATPCLNPPQVTAQTVMLAIDGKLLATVQWRELQIMAFRLPPGSGQRVLSLVHLAASLPRAPAQMRRGIALGLAVHSMRLFQTPPEATAGATCDRVAGSSADGSLQCRVEQITGLSVTALAERFESLGQGCQFGLVQRNCGADPLGLLRFVDTTTSMLTDGLVTAFSGIGDPGLLELYHTADAVPRYRWRHRTFGLLYDTRVPVPSLAPEILLRREQRRLGFLQRKFVEDLGLAEKICVLTRGDCLTEPEALSVFCALRLHGPVTLLWTTPGDAASAGRVDRLQAGFLRGHLGPVDAHGYGPQDIWLSLMGNAFKEGKQSFFEKKDQKTFSD